MFYIKTRSRKRRKLCEELRRLKSRLYSTDKVTCQMRNITVAPMLLRVIMRYCIPAAPLPPYLQRHVLYLRTPLLWINVSHVATLRVSKCLERWRSGRVLTLVFSFSVGMSSLTLDMILFSSDWLIVTISLIGGWD